MQGGVEGGANLYHQPGMAHLLQNDDGADDTNTGSGGVADADTQSSSNFYAAEKIGKRWQQQQHLDHQPARFEQGFVMHPRRGHDWQAEGIDPLCIKSGQLEGFTQLGAGGSDNRIRIVQQRNAATQAEKGGVHHGLS